MIRILLLVMSVTMMRHAFSERFVLPPAGVDIVGMVRQVNVQKDEDLLDIGRQFGIGVEAMRHANPDVDLWAPEVGKKVLVPSRYILPEVPREGIVINLPEMRLYYFPEGKSLVYVYAIGIGREDWGTPLGVHTITEKRPNPTWTPPASLRAEHAAKGDILPAVVEAGPNNPLGLFAMRLSNPSYLIHGTNKPWGVGMRVSHGCIRMFPEGIKELFAMTPQGTKVNVIKQEMKVGWFGDELFLEYHPPIDEDRISAQAAMKKAIAVVTEKASARGLHVSENLIRAVVEEASGMPVPVTTPPANNL